MFGLDTGSATGRELLPEEARAALAGLRIRPAIRADGRVGGVHRSTHVGQSLEFSELKAYAFGDDRRSVDWRVFARTDRLYVRRFLDETNLTAHLVLDASGSMAYPSPLSKYSHAAAILAGFAYVLLRQSDEVSLTVAHETRPRFCPPRGTPSCLPEVLASLAETTPSGQTVLESALKTLSVQGPRRGLVVVASDLLTRIDPVLALVRALVARGHCVIVFHVLSPDERSFPFHGPIVFRCEETGEEALLDATGLKRHYVAALDRFLARVHAGCHDAGAFHVSVTLTQPPHGYVAEAVRLVSGEAGVGRAG